MTASLKNTVIKELQEANEETKPESKLCPIL
jgi:hypothetical protein